MNSATVWVAYNSENDCFASHEGAQEAADGLLESFGHAEGMRVVELTLSLSSIKPLTAQATVPDRDGSVSVTIK